MTPSARAKKIADQLLRAFLDGNVWSPDSIPDLATVVARALDAERERCLKIAESARIPDKGNTSTQTLWMNEAADEIAKAIRALADEETP